MNDGPPITMSPGTLLDGRYRLEVLLSEHGGARFWRATDTVLARNVAVHVLPSEDPRAPGVLEAARRSAEVTEQHFLRVLDCDEADGIAWVINEWGAGSSLDLMLDQGPLPPMRAAWLAREVAEAIAVAHARGFVHGRLNPEAVLVTDAGSVKIIGFAVTAAIEGEASASTTYGPISPREADVIDLAGILYAALTGRWPGVAPSALPPAPREGNHPLRPRQVRAGVPRTLDAICERVLHKEASQHVLPVETAYEIAAALSDYVGDPAAVAPVDLPSIHDPIGVGEETGATSVAAGIEGEPEAVPAAPPPPPAPLPAPPPPPEPVAEPVSEPVSRPLVDPDATMASGPILESVEFFEPDAWEPPPPPPAFEAAVDRPLFASEERRVPVPPPGSVPPAEPTNGWPFEETPGPRTGSGERPRRRGRRTVLILVMVLLVAAAAYGAFLLGADDGDRPSSSGTPTPTTAAPPTPVVTGTPIPVVQSGDFDPEGDPPEENPKQVPLAFDGDPTTSWATSRYQRSANLGGLKSGVGLVLDLGSEQEVGSVQVTLVGEPTDLELYGTGPGINDPPAELAATTRLGALNGVGTSAVFRLDPKVRTRYLVVWLTRLPEVSGGFQGKIAEITVRS